MVNECFRDGAFLNGGVASVTTVMHDGTMVETATIGDEAYDAGCDRFIRKPCPRTRSHIETSAWSSTVGAEEVSNVDCVARALLGVVD